MTAIQRQLLISVARGLLTLSVWNFLITPLITLHTFWNSVIGFAVELAASEGVAGF